jgi:uncharacterized membrane protein YqgA involved in biofilm formation
MIGTSLNVAGIVLGGLAGLLRRKSLSVATESYFKVALAAFTVFYGLRLVWLSFEGPLLKFLKDLVILVLALMLGRLTGRLLHFQRTSNRLGRYARDRLAAVKPGNPPQPADGFKVCAALFCAAPLGLLGAVQDGLSSGRYPVQLTNSLPQFYFYPLAIKAVIDGLATMGFVSVFGWSSMLAALPVLVLQGSIALVCMYCLGPVLNQHGLLQSVYAVGGILVTSVALVMLGLKRIELADYLPSLLFAPLLTRLLA